MPDFHDWEREPMVGDLSPDLERVRAEIVATLAGHQPDGNSLDTFCTCGGWHLSTDPLPFEHHVGDVVLARVLAVRAQCGTCGDTKTVCCGACDCGNDPRARRDGAYYCERCKQTGVEPCPDCRGGAPLPVLVPSAQLRPHIIHGSFGDGPVTLYRLRETTEDSDA